mmetsp:Transcript_55469/g.132555  ORF Transcript_55469/g.132555 Transcript_55469/m.132555 type:complete len:233 (+) Transcript_55469:787-1485(+)
MHGQPAKGSSAKQGVHLMLALGLVMCRLAVHDFLQTLQNWRAGSQRPRLVKSHSTCHCQRVQSASSFQQHPIACSNREPGEVDQGRRKNQRAWGCSDKPNQSVVYRPTKWRSKQQRWHRRDEGSRNDHRKGPALCYCIHKSHELRSGGLGRRGKLGQALQRGLSGLSLHLQQQRPINGNRSRTHGVPRPNRLWQRLPRHVAHAYLRTSINYSSIDRNHLSGPDEDAIAGAQI